MSEQKTAEDRLTEIRTELSKLISEYAQVHYDDCANVSDATGVTGWVVSYEFFIAETAEETHYPATKNFIIVPEHQYPSTTGGLIQQSHSRFS